MVAACLALQAWSTQAHAAQPTQHIQALAVESAANIALAAWLEAHSEHFQLEVEPVRGPLKAPAGHVKLSVRTIADDRRITARMAVLVDVRVNDHFVRTLPVVIRAHAQRKGWIAVRDLAAGHEVAEEDFKLGEVELTALDGALHPGAVNGLRLEVPVFSGQVLMAHQARPRPTVLRGDAVELRSNAEGIALRAQAVALHDADSGKPVRVRLATVGAILEARVVARGVVELAP
jgi:flagella basal body P-ring formation protein FlgA